MCGVNDMDEKKVESIIFGLKETIAEQKAEIERLTEELDKAYEIERANIQAEIADAGTSCHWCERQTVKDTLEEIYKEIGKGDILIVQTQEYGEIEVVPIERLKEIIKKKGVEVE